MNTVTVNSSPDLPYESVETGSVFAFIDPEGGVGAPCMKTRRGHMVLDGGDEYEVKTIRDEKCRLIHSITITRG